MKKQSKWQGSKHIWTYRELDLCICWIFVDPNHLHQHNIKSLGELMVWFKHSANAERILYPEECYGPFFPSENSSAPIVHNSHAHQSSHNHLHHLTVQQSCQTASCGGREEGRSQHLGKPRSKRLVDFFHQRTTDNCHLHPQEGSKV